MMTACPLPVKRRTCKTFNNEVGEARHTAIATLDEARGQP